MAVSNLTTKVKYAGNDSTTAFSISFDFRNNSEIEVWLRDENASPATETLQALTTNYTISGGDPGTTVDMVTAPATGEELLIRRVTPKTQATDYSATADFPANAHEEALDKLTLQVQELGEKIGRAPTLPETSDDSADLPEPENGKFIRWDGSGNLENGTDISTADLASQVDAEGGTNNTDFMSPLRVQQWLAVQDTDDLSEGAANFYYTEARFDTSLSGKTTTDLAEGTNEYYTDAKANTRADAQIALADIGDLANVDETGKAVTNVLAWDGANWSPVAAGAGAGTNNAPNTIENLGLETTAAASALTISLKQADGSTDPAAGSGAVKIAFRDANSADGGFTIVQATAATSVTIDSGATLGLRSGEDEDIFVYAFNDAGTIKLAVSTRLREENKLDSAVLMSVSADNDTMYADTTISTKAVRLIGKVIINEATIGTWSGAADQIILAGTQKIDYSTQFIGATSSEETLTGNGHYPAMTNNEITFPPGKWQLNGMMQYRSTPSTAGYTTEFIKWSSADGADSSTEPADINAPATVTLEAGASATARTEYVQSSTDALRLPAPTIRLTITASVTLYLVSRVFASTAGNGRLIAQLYAERVK